MIVAVIGSDGYIGKTLCKYLEDDKHTVLRFDAQVYGQSLHYATVKTGYASAIVDALKQQRPDAIVWLAAFAHDPANRIPTQRAQDNNCIRPSVVARWAADHLIPFIAVSSLSVFSYIGAYPASKRCLEHALLGTPQACRFVDIVRFGTLYGCDHYDTHIEAFRSHLLLNSMVLSGIVDKNIKISLPTTRRPVTSLHQAAAFLRELVYFRGPRGRIQNVYQTCGTLQQYAEAVKEMLSHFAYHSEIEVVGGEDQRDYGWGEFDVGAIQGDSYQLIRWIEKHRGILRGLRDEFPANLYRYLGLTTDGTK